MSGARVLRALVLGDILRQLPDAPIEVLREVEAVLAGGAAPRALVGAKLATAERIIARNLPALRAARKGDRAAIRRVFDPMVAALAKIDPAIAAVTFTGGDLDAVLRRRSERAILAYVRLRTGALGCPRRRARPMPDDIAADVSLIAKNIEAAKRRT